jgi:hypothetical protein
MWERKMRFQFYIEKLFAMEKFQEFIEENSDAYPCSGFFVIDSKSQEVKQHFDYFVPSINKMFSFQLDNNSLIPIENFNCVPEKIALNYDFDFKEIEGLILKKMNDEKINKSIEKILFSFQSKEGKGFLLGTVFISGMGLLKLLIDIEEMQIKEFEKKSFMDIFCVFKGKKNKE